MQSLITMQSLILLIVYLMALLALAWPMGLYLAKEHGNALRCVSVANIVPSPLILNNIWSSRANGCKHRIQNSSFWGR